jgi:hypothetical protein
MVHGDVDDVANEFTAALGAGDVSEVVANEPPASLDRPSQPVSLERPSHPGSFERPSHPGSLERPSHPAPSPVDALDVDEEILTKPLPKIVGALPSSPEISAPAMGISPELVDEMTGPTEPRPLPSIALEPVIHEPLMARVLAALGAVAPPRLGTLVGIAIVAFVSTVLIMVWTRSPRDEGAPTLSFEAPSEAGQVTPPSAVPAPARTATLSIDDLPGTPPEPDTQLPAERGSRDAPVRGGRAEPIARPRPAPASPAEKPAAESSPRAAPNDAPAGTGSATPPPNPYKNKR